MKRDIISVIIPVFNVRQYLNEALSSIIHQTYTNLEIIIIDDGSTDGSSSICDEYAKKDSRIIVVHQANLGLSKARNVGLDLMKGDAVAFLDSDDVYLPDFISLMYNAMKREMTDIVICKYTYHKTLKKMKLNQSKKWPSAPQGIYDRKKALRALADNCINVSVWNKLYRKELWKKIRFPEGHVYEDLDTTYRIFDLCKNIYVLDKTLCINRIRPGSITETNSWTNALDYYRAWSHFNSYVEKNTPEVFWPGQVKKGYQSCVDRMLKLYLNYPKIMVNKCGSLGVNPRNYIIIIGKKIGFETCSFRTQVAYKLLCLCPEFLKKVYLIYKSIHTLLKVIFLQ